jgi:E3 ubiquitin-protein ligase SHPRH
LLTRPLLVNDEEADGQEYARSLEVQGEAGTYFRVYAALLSDRKAAISSERTLLAAHDAKERKLRRTKAAAQAMAAEVENKDEDEIEQDPRHDILYRDLSEQRNALITPFQGRALKSVLFDLNSAATRIVSDKDPENVIIRRCVQSLRQLIAAQGRSLFRVR